MRLLVLSSYPESIAATRFRASAYFPYLRDAGIEPTLHPFLGEELTRKLYEPGHQIAKATGTILSAIRRLQLLGRSGHFDGVFIQREASLVGPPWFELALEKLYHLPIFFDFDDAIWLDSHQSSRHPWAARLLKQPGKTRRLIRHAAHVIAGNHYLAEYAENLGAKTTVLPTVVSRESWTPLSGRMEGEWASRDGIVTIGWVGTHSTARQLELIVPALSELARRGHRFRVRLVGSATELRIPGVQVCCVPWALEREIEDFRSADLAVVPMFDNAWSQGKCGFKQLQSMAVGVPVVSSAKGGAKDFLQHEGNALVAESANEFTSNLERLLLDPALRGRLARAGRDLVEKRFCTEEQGPVLAQLVSDVLSRGSHATSRVAPLLHREVTPTTTSNTSAPIPIDPTVNDATTE